MQLLSSEQLLCIRQSSDCESEESVSMMCGLSTFSENMTAGRGFLAYASVLVGDGNPLVSGLIAVVFAYADALMLTLTQKGYPTQLIQTFPYVAVIIV